MTTNIYYTPDGLPPAQTRGTSAGIRNEFAMIQAGFNLLAAQFAGYVGATLVSGVDGGLVNAYTLTPSVPLPAYGAKMLAVFSPSILSTGPVTLNISGLGAVVLNSATNAALVAGDLVVGAMYIAAYNGTNFTLLSNTKNYVDLAVSAAAGIAAAATNAEATTRAANDNAEAATRAANDNAEAATRAANDNAEITRAEAAEALLAPLNSAALIGTPTTPTPALGTSNNQIASTAYVMAQAFSVLSAPIPLTLYVNRANLRASGSSGALAVLESVGMFEFVVASIEPDDDETCFATSTGCWELRAADPDYVFASWLAEFDNLQGRATDLETRATADELAIASNATSITTLQAFQAAHLFATFSMTLTSLATLISSNFTVTVAGAIVGMPVIVNPGDQFGTSSADQGKLSCIAYVSAANTVTVSIRNASAATATLTASTWSVLVIN